MPKITIRNADFAIMLHTLGLTDIYREESYRNHFVAGKDHSDMPTLLRLCEVGMMREADPPRFLESGDRVFCVTDLGKAYVAKHRERPSRAKKRYNSFLSLLDCCPDLTFKTFLTDPQYKLYR